MLLNSLERRIIDLSFKHKLTHISSCLNTVNVLSMIYQKRGYYDPVVQDNAHAALALYVVLESHGLCDAEEMIHKHGTHQGRDMEHGIWVSGGSLGQAATVAVGMALADRKRTVWLVTSDGACSEGCIWESFRLASDLGLHNLRIHIIANGYGGYCEIDVEKLRLRLMYFHPLFISFHEPTIKYPPFLQGLSGHYSQLSEEQYQEMIQ